MTSSGDIRVVFRVAAGPRRGFGHLVRCLSLARAIGVRPLFAVRGGRAVVEVALALGADVIDGRSGRALQKIQPDLVVVDDPVAATARKWIAAARRAGAVVVTVHDLGIGCAEGDIVLDGSVTRQARACRGAMALTGSRFAILDPRLKAHARRRPKTASRAAVRNVLVALGGGPRRNTALSVARSIVAKDSRARVRIAGGFVSNDRPSPARENRVTWVPARRGLARELTRATVAVVGGGMSLYEAAAMGVPSVGLPVVAAQSPTVRAFARRGAAVAVPFRAPDHRTAAETVALLDDPHRRMVLARRSMQLVDGHGAARAAAAVLDFMTRKRA